MVFAMRSCERLDEIRLPDTASKEAFGAKTLAIGQYTSSTHLTLTDAANISYCQLSTNTGGPELQIRYCLLCQETLKSNIPIKHFHPKTVMASKS